MSINGLKRIFLLTALLLGMTVPLSAPAFAATDPFNKSRVCTAAADSTVCKTAGNEDPLTGPNGVITKATNVMAVLAGIVAVIFLIIGGLKYVTSNGDPQQISRAKETVIYALVGLVVVLLARAIIGFVLTKV